MGKDQRLRGHQRDESLAGGRERNQGRKEGAAEQWFKGASDALLPGCDLECDPKRAYFWRWEEARSRQGMEVEKTHPK